MASREVIQKDKDFTMIIIGFREAQGRLVVIENKKILIVLVIKHTDPTQVLAQNARFILTGLTPKF